MARLERSAESSTYTHTPLVCTHTLAFPQAVIIVTDNATAFAIDLAGIDITSK